MSPRPSGGEAIAPAALAMLRMAAGAVFFQALLALRARFGRLLRRRRLFSGVTTCDSRACP